MTIALLAALALQGAAATTPALPAPGQSGWLRIGGDSSGEFAVWPPSISRTGNEVTADIRIDVTRGERTGAHVLGVVRYVYNCPRDTMRTEAAEIYSGDGERLGETPISAERRADRPVPPGTPSASVRDYLCRGHEQ